MVIPVDYYENLVNIWGNPSQGLSDPLFVWLLHPPTMSPHVFTEQRFDVFNLWINFLEMSDRVSLLLWAKVFRTYCVCISADWEGEIVMHPCYLISHGSLETCSKPVYHAILNHLYRSQQIPATSLSGMYFYIAQYSWKDGGDRLPLTRIQ